MVMYMDIANSVLQLIGRTPMVRLVRVTEGIPCPVIAKVETQILEEASKIGLL